jgi:formylglycine-generating enzyme required for sulfatase activity
LNILVECVDDEPLVLANVLMEATPRHFQRLYALPRSHSAAVASCLESELNKSLTDEHNEEEKESLGQRQARAAIALLRMGRGAKVRPLLRAAREPRARTYVIHWARDFGVEASELINQLVGDPVGADVSVQRALLLSLGPFPIDQLPRQQQQSLITQLLLIYRNHADPGLHSAAAWLLRQWGQSARLAEVDEQLKENEAQLRSRTNTDLRRWYVNSQGDTYVIVDAGEFMMGSPETEPDRDASETWHPRRISRVFAIAATEVTRGQFQKYLQAVHGPQVETDYVAAVMKDSRTEHSPAVRPTWFDAAEYCNWLSECEGIPPEQWCYEPNEHGEFYVGMKPARDFVRLTGYRLPTEAEWEYACRAGTATSRYFGASTKLLVHYGRYEANSDNHVWPVGGLKPNDLGLFDMLGNVYEWCHERYQDYPGPGGEPLADAVDIQEVEDRIGRVKRGGSYFHFARFLRSSSRAYGDPDNRSSSIGFRPVRTFR